MANYCQYCGNELDPDANFCSDCGEPVEETDDRVGDSSGWSTRDTDRREPTGRANSTDRYGTSTGWSTLEQSAGGDTTIAALAHASALFTWVLGPLIVLLATEDEFVEQNARNALNWQIMFTIYMVVSVILVFVLVGVLFIAIFGVLDMIFCVVAAVKASEGNAWKYPLTPDIF